MRVRRFLAWSLICLSISGCGTDGMDDLREFVATTHADRKPRVEPLPEVKTQQTFAYSAADLSDPFATFNLSAQAAGSGGSGLQPDPNRRKEPLEDYPLDALKMVGTITRGKRSRAVIQAPDGTVHQATVGNHLGHNFGMITKISEDKIELIELIQGGLVGDWIERQASLALADD